MQSRLFLIFLCVLLHLPLQGAGGLFSIDFRPSCAFSSYRDDIVSGILDMEDAKKTTLATSLHLQYGFQFPRNSKQGRICPDAWQGIGTAVNFLGNPKGIGTPVSVYAFQGAPIWKFSDKLSLYYEWNFGASFGWHPTKVDTDSPFRGQGGSLIVGSRVNAYINLGAGLKYRLSDRWSLIAGLDLTHYSNGNTSFPNPGVNLAGLRVGIIADIVNGGEASRLPVPSGRASGDLFEEQEAISNQTSPFRGQGGLSFDITLYGALRKRVYRGGEAPVLLDGRFAVAGLDFAPMWRITKNFRTGPSLDLQWDESTDLKRHYISGTTSDDIIFTRPSFFRQVCVGLSGRAELVMPLFSVNVGMGYNVIGPEETRATYQLANLKVRLTDALFINVGYQLLNFQKQNNLMLGLGYTFH